MVDLYSNKTGGLIERQHENTGRTQCDEKAGAGMIRLQANEHLILPPRI
jgi:hypothetical protein